MKTLYCLILYRPQGSKTWTPYENFVRDTGNFFGNREKAVDFARKLMSENRQEYMFGENRYVPLEFNVGSVVLEKTAPVQPF